MFMISDKSSPIMMTASCCASSIRQPPFPHYNRLYIQQTSKIIHLFVPESSKDVFVMAGVADKLSFEECDVDDGGIEIDELEDEDFEGEIVVILGLCPVHF